MSPRALAAVRACAERIAAVEPPEGPGWSDVTRAQVREALLDRAGTAQELARAIDAASSSWRDARSFRAWIASLGGVP